MVAPALCIPCMAAATTTGPAAPLLIGVSSLGAAGYYSLKKSKKKKKRSNKKKDKKKKKTKQRGGTISLNKDFKKIRNKSTKCHKKCPELTLSSSQIHELSSEEKKQWNKKRVERNRCWSKCNKIKQNDIRLHKKKFSKEYRDMNKEKKKDCCKCHYVKSDKTLRRVKGPYSHCSYDSDNCCKDKKTIYKQ